MTMSIRICASMLGALLCACNSSGTGDQVAARNTSGSSGAPAAQTGTASPQDSLLAIADTARIRGAASAPVWIVEVSDFQCPYCRLWHEETYPAVVREYVSTGRARLAFLNLPLPSHKHAWPAAEAAMCAGLQGRFWEMHDAIFQAQERWSRMTSVDSIFGAMAADVGVDVARWRGCISSHVMRPLIEADYQRAVSAGVNSTPSFFIGDRQLSGAMPLDSFRLAIDAAIGKAAGAAPR
jgi:protein-disulfide isomerase